MILFHKRREISTSDKDTQEIFDGIMAGLNEGIRFNKGEATGAKVKRVKMVFRPTTSTCTPGSKA